MRRSVRALRVHRDLIHDGCGAQLIDLHGGEVVGDSLPGAELVEQTLIRHRPRPDAALGANRSADRHRCRGQILELKPNIRAKR